MPKRHCCLPALLAGTLLALLTSMPAAAQPKPELHDGQHDFDFELGSWKIHLKRLLNPLTGSSSWQEFDGTSVTRKVWNGRANLEEFETDGAAGHIEGLTLRLYNPQSRQWSLYWANAKDGILNQPTIGEFKNGVGEFIDQEPYKGRSILVRFLWSAITPNSAHFEQSFSDDGGRTWEVNWITDQTRVSDDPAPTDSAAPKNPQTAADDPAHNFDFEFGAWKAHLRRLLHPLTGSDTWTEYDGTSVVRKIWNGRANLGELEVGNATTHIEGLTLRLYHPPSHQWSLYWASSSDGVLNVPTVGEFKEGRGEFFDQEDFQSRSIFVRFVFSDVSSNSFRAEQSFSIDGGKTWETNWSSTFARQQ
ncbi:MAG TPA: hypothetical protein VKV39_15975 [Candidatus Sulfotelmatobacter sp.]|nr:hypothetical protein [Candidatus Sulfotelmatobacter sp.]